MELTHDEWKAIDEAIKKFNVTADERTLRKLVMEALRGIIPYDFGDFCYAIQVKGHEFIVVDPITVTKYSESFIRDFQSLYDTKYGQQDYTKWCLNSKESLVYRESDVISNEIRKKNEYYNDFLKPRNLLYSIGAYIIRNRGKSGAIALYRGEDLGDFTDKELYILNVILPHIELRMNLNSTENDIDLIYSRKARQLKNDYGLTWREIEIAKMIENGYSNKEIANLLYIGVNTVKKHITHILSKTGAENRIKFLKLLRDI